MMIIIILISLVAIAIAVIAIKGKRFMLMSFIAAALLALTSILLFELLKGPHPECGVNDSVGPCPYDERVLYILPLGIYPTMLFWAIIVIVELVSTNVRKHLALKKR